MSRELFFKALKDPETWSEAKQPDPVRLASFVAIAQQQRTEKDVARKLLPVLLNGGADEWRDRVQQIEGCRSSGMVSILLETGGGGFATAPSRVLEIADLAIDICERSLASEAVQSILLRLAGESWKLKANALRVLGRNREAIQAIEKARALFEQLKAGAIDLAAVDFVLATILSGMGEDEKPLELLERSKKIFAEHDDTRMLFKSRFLEGILKFRKGEADQPKEIFLSLLNESKENGDLEMQAGLFNNIGHCFARLKEYDAAISCFREAEEIYGVIGGGAERIRVSWGIGRLLLNIGRLSLAAQELAEVRARFRERGMIQDSAFVGIEIVEAYAAMEQLDGLHDLCDEIVSEMQASGLSGRALIAVAHLRMEVDQRLATGESVRYVRQFVEDLRTQPNLTFSPRKG